MKKITFARIITRLISRFKLQELSPETFKLSETITPITNADDLLKTSKIASTGAIDISGGATTLFTVPAGKRWLVWGLSKGATVGSVSVYANDTSENNAIFYVINGTTASTIVVAQNFPLEELDKLICSVGNVADTSITFRVYYWEEDAY